MAFKFRLYLENGEDVGEYTTGVLQWRPGDRLYDEGRTKFEVLDVVDLPEGGDLFVGALVVSPLELPEPVDAHTETP